MSKNKILFLMIIISLMLLFGFQIRKIYKHHNNTEIYIIEKYKLNDYLTNELDNDIKFLSNNIKYSNEEIYFMISLLKKDINDISLKKDNLENDVFTQDSYNNLLSEISNNSKNINYNNNLIEENKDIINNYNVFLKNHPVGSIYFSEKNVNPGTIFGGSWEQISDKFILGVGSLASLNTINENLLHQHKYGMEYGGYFRLVSIEENPFAGLLDYSNENDFTLTGSGVNDGTTLEAPINNAAVKTFLDIDMTHYRIIAKTSKETMLPPYLSIYIWRRIS